MRIDVFFADRVGIAHEILATLARRALDVSAVEVDPPHIYLEAPALSAQDMAALRSELFKVDGVQSVAELEMLPGARRRLYLDALLASQADPVLAVDGHGVVMVANAAAVLASGVPESQLTGMSLQALTGDAQLVDELISQGYRLPPCEVTRRRSATATRLRADRSARSALQPAARARESVAPRIRRHGR